MKKTALTAVLLSAVTAWAQPDELPARPINIVVGYAAGGSSDTVARIVGKALAERIGRPVVVTNKPGASGTTAAAEVGRAKPDSNTFLLFTTPMLLAKHVYKDIRLDVITELTPVSMIYDLPNVLAVSSVHSPGIKNLQDLIDHARKRPGGLNFGSGGTGSIGQLAIEDLKSRKKFNAQHIGYKGGAPAVVDLLGGQIDMVNADMVAVLPHIRSGKLHAVAIGSAQRVSILPNTPTLAEQGVPGFTSVAWGALLAPKDTPPQIVARLDKELREVLKSDAIRTQLLNTGAIVAYGGPAETARRLRDDDQRWGKVARTAGVTAE
ncbi:tripartite tricarboxylate transporter substrate binding protein [Cupriavidus sp. L7L]|uniref:Bug family tripartite tricarboxylate transporter substrate binding protein n=1 Tax=Cupriavidus sp. L7L TaxID=2546443 RepID=UPI00105683AE|nr:tripartite tricarboxylate transporter substrate binding protein [Cupriavidus sp. L7L]TDF64546.1 tripartite tricarboxylate transporter substrate binding protein [Cupriavidus sp. L7L]